MRSFILLVVLLSPALAGCLSGDDGTQSLGDDRVIKIDPTNLPKGAKLVEDAQKVVLQWTDILLPLNEEVEIPEGTTIVSLVTQGPAGVGVRSYMADAETDRRRCNTDSLDAWNLGVTGTHTCSGTSLIDPPGTTWRIAATGPADTIADVRLEFSSAPLDGIARHLDLGNLSMPAYELEPTTGQYVASFDGTDLWVEVTLPEGEGPWPTIIAASPYNGQSGRIDGEGGTPAMWMYFTHDWARRGYAVVNADVRGFGLSGGCVEIWGINEQKDQAFIVDWVADQSWSDGTAGFYGQSYVGTTPVAAAVQAPDALKAIIAVAPVINAYEDWHYGGVPNGENAGSPVAYQVLTDVPGQGSTPQEILDNANKGVCDPTILARANDPRAVYDDFYRERDFKLRADQVKAAVLYTEGFEDSNVKSAMIPGWFNELTSPKLGLFGHWVHQHPTRADEEIMFLGWMDHYVKGRDLGFDKLPNMEVVTNVQTVRQGDAWPDLEAPVVELWPDYVRQSMSPEEADSPDVPLAVLPADGGPVSQAINDPPPGTDLSVRTQVRAEYAIDEPLAISGIPLLNVRGTLNSQGNAYLAAELYDESSEGTHLVSYGMFNLAHEDGHDQWTPVAASASDVDLPFLPTEWVFEPGHRLVITLRAVQAGGDGLTAPGPPGVFTLGEHTDGMGPLQMSTVDMAEYQPLPVSAQP